MWTVAFGPFGGDFERKALSKSSRHWSRPSSPILVVMPGICFDNPKDTGGEIKDPAYTHWYKSLGARLGPGIIIDLKSPVFYYKIPK